MTSIPSDILPLIETASRLIQKADYCVAITGAGISTPSGIPDFRSPGSGLWTKVSPFEVASLTTFRYHPERFFDWIRPLLYKLTKATPNPAHEALARLENSNYLHSIVTQNIDALHQRAGSKEVIEIHGTIETLTCLECYQQQKASEELLRDFLEQGDLPTCPFCSGLLKPDVILFEEQLPVQLWNRAKQDSQQCDLMLVLGSSLTVTPACNLPLTALQSGAKIILINQTPTSLDPWAEIAIHGDLADILPELEKKVLADER